MVPARYLHQSPNGLMQELFEKALHLLTKTPSPFKENVLTLLLMRQDVLFFSPKTFTSPVCSNKKHS